jgi:pyruvate dehydrogenase (quinone)
MCRARLFALATQISIPRSRKTCPSRFAIYDNGKLGFVDIEQKAAGLVPLYTDLKNPNFGEVAKAMGLWGRQVSKAGELEESVQTWLAQPGAAVLHVKVKAMQLVTPPSPFVSPEAVVGMGVYTAKAMLQGKGKDVWELLVGVPACCLRQKIASRHQRPRLPSAFLNG